jgi:flagellar biosynthesis component FlhA
MNGGLIGVLVLFLTACASQPPVPTDQMAVARNAIDYAVEMGARDHAPADLKQARDHLAEAERAVEQGENEIARQLALEAEKIARLADRKARSARSRRQVEQLEDTVEALREEIARAQGGSS